MINKVILVGRVTRDPELKYTPSNTAFCNFTIAVNRTFQNQQGDRDADFISCTVWRNQAENLARFIKKGGLIGVEGRIQTRNYEAEDGNTRYITEVLADSIQFLEPKGNNSDSDYQPKRTNNEQVRQTNTNNAFQQQPKASTREEEFDPFFNESSKATIDIEDDLPF